MATQASAISQSIRKPTQAKKATPATIAANANLYTNNISGQLSEFNGEQRGDRHVNVLTVEQQAELMSMSDGEFYRQLGNFINNFIELLKIHKKIKKLSSNLGPGEVLIKTVNINNIPNNYYLTSNSESDFLDGIIFYMRMSKKVFQFNKRLARRETAVRTQKRFQLFNGGAALLDGLINGSRQADGSTIGGFSNQFQSIRDVLNEYLFGAQLSDGSTSGGNLVRTQLSKILWSIVKVYEYQGNVNLINDILQQQLFAVKAETGNLVLNVTPATMSTFQRTHEVPRNLMKTKPPKNGYEGPVQYELINYVGNRARDLILNYVMSLIIMNSNDGKGTISVNEVDPSTQGSITASIATHLKGIRDAKSAYLNGIRNLDVQNSQNAQGYRAELINRDIANRRANAGGSLDGEINTVSHKAASDLARVKRSNKKLARLGASLEDERITGLITSLISLIGRGVAKESPDYELSAAQTAANKAILLRLNQAEDATELISNLNSVVKYRRTFINSANRALRGNVQAPQNVILGAGNL